MHQVGRCVHPTPVGVGTLFVPLSAWKEVMNMPNLYLIEAYTVHDGYRELVGSEHLVASSWEEAIREARPHWPVSVRLRVRECGPTELADYIEAHCP